MNNTAKNFLLDLLFPIFCFGCQKEGGYLCYDCKSTLEISEYNYCLCLKNPIRILSGVKSGKCQKCRDKKLSGLYSALPYKEKPITQKLIRSFKYKPYIKDLAKTLADIIIDHLVLTGNYNENTRALNKLSARSSTQINDLSALVWQNSVLVSVPLFKKRLKERNYNQSEELAKELSKIIKLPLIENCLVKIRKTPPQADLSAKEREINLKNAFAVENPAKVTDKKVFLVDDVYTTGATMEECANVLRTSGVRSVWGLVVAREG